MAEEKSVKKVASSGNLKYQRDKDREKVKGVFHFYEVPGGTLSFSYKAYKEDQVEKYTLEDGKIATIPLGVAKHLNKNGWYPEYEYFKDEETRNVMKIAKKVRRFGFESLEFVDISDMEPSSPIVKVEMTEL
jgi:hypothetical protein